MTLEAILALPILAIAMFASFQFAMILMVQQTLQYAAIQAARDASMLDTTNNSDRLAAAVATAQNVLAVYDLEVCPALPATGDVQVITEDFDDGANQVLTCGPSVVSAPAVSVAPGSVRVHLAVNLDSVPIPNMLAYFKFDLAGKHLYVKSDAIKEYP